MIGNSLNKIRYKTFGYVKIGANGKKRGYALLSYITMPFTVLPWQINTDPHSSYWEVQEIARILSLHGFEVHVIDHKNTNFIPSKKYSLFIDIGKNLERLRDLLPTDCKKIFHIVSASPEFQNQAENKRLEYLETRSGIKLTPRRSETENKSALYADYLEGFGNETIKNSYRYTNKPIYDIPISVAKTFDFTERNYDESKKRFLWFGGGGAILKGLDIVLEVFSQLPQLELAVVGPIKAEIEFYTTFKKFFELPNIKLYDRPKFKKDGEIYLNDTVNLKEFFTEFGFMIYPSASDTASGSVVQSMHAGIIPIITKETGLDERAPVIFLDNINIGFIRRTVFSLSQCNNTILKNLSMKVWDYARSKHTKNSFSIAYNEFIEKILNE